MADNDPCEVCQLEKAETVRPGVPGGDYMEQKCGRCGTFRITGSAFHGIRSLKAEQRIKLSAWVRERNELREVPTIRGAQIDSIENILLPNIFDRVDRFIAYVVRHEKKLGHGFDLDDPALKAITYSLDNDEWMYLIGYLQKQELIENMGGGSGKKRLTPRGYERFEEVREAHTASTQGFVAMWFEERMGSAYEHGFEPAVRSAGYNPLRIDLYEHAGKIDDAIVAQIRRSRFLVADFTGQRGGVYFEAGFALGLNLPVIWTCRKDDLENLHFDTRQYNFIDWSEPEELARRLQNRIEAVIGAAARV